MSPRNPSSSTQEALADAAAGVAGALVAMLSFYPIDVLKTNLQASSSSSAAAATTTNQNTNTSMIKTIHKWKEQILTIAFIKSIFRGLHYKAAHTITSSFTYFFIYSFIKSQHKKQYMLFLSKRVGNGDGGGGGGGGGGVYNPSTMSRLVLSALAGMVNVTLTFPLDVLAARSQTKKNSTVAIVLDSSNDGQDDGHLDVDKNQHHSEKHNNDKPNQQNITTATSSSSSHEQNNNNLLQNVMDQVWNNLQINDNSENITKTKQMSNCSNNIVHNHNENDEWEGYDTADDDLSFDDINQIKMECKVGELNQHYDQDGHDNHVQNVVDEDDGDGDDNDDNDDDNDDGLSYSDHYANNDYDDILHGSSSNRPIASDETTINQTVTRITNPSQQQQQQKKLHKEPTIPKPTNSTHMYRYPSIYQPIPSQMMQRTISLVNKSVQDETTTATKTISTTTLPNTTRRIEKNNNTVVINDDNNNNDVSNHEERKTVTKHNQQESLSNSYSPKIYNFFQLWSGIKPALLLCSNPAINFTIFDIVKEHLIVYKQKTSTRTTTQHQNQNHRHSIRISMMEAFLIGLIAKFAATIVTYPLIRAKVMLMVADKNKRNRNQQQQQQQRNKQSRKRRNHNNDDDDDETMTTEDEIPTSISMVSILYNICIKEGIQGLYKGCGLQLIHTMLKSALLMMVRERINVTTRRLIVGSTK